MTYLHKPSDEFNAKCLAAALLSLFPQISILKAEASPRGFCCLFEGNELIHLSQFPFIEQKMRELVKQKEFQFFEMAKKSAIEFLHYHGRKKKALELKSWSEGLVDLIKIGPFVDLMEKAEEKVSPASFKILSVEEKKQDLPQGNKNIFLIEAIAANDEKGLKEKVRLFKQLGEKFHIPVLLQQGIIEKQADKLLWTEEGKEVQQTLKKGLEERFLKCGISRLCFITTFSNKDVFEYLQNTRKTACYYNEVYFLKSSEKEGFFSLDTNHGYEFFLQHERGASMKKDLKNFFDSFLEKLPFNMHVDESDEYDLSSLEKNIDSLKEQETLLHHLYGQDLFGSSWLLFKVEIKKAKSQNLCKISFVSIERFLGLLAESSLGVKETINLCFSDLKG